MRYSIAIAVAVLWVGTAVAEEPAACYVARDTTGDFVQNRLQSLGANPGTAAQVTHLLNQNNRLTSKCIQKHMEREGGWPSGAEIQYGVRIAPTGKVTQVSVLGVKKVNDAMLMACIGRSMCEWTLEANADGKEQLVKLPPYIFRKHAWPTLRAPG